MISCGWTIAPVDWVHFLHYMSRILRVLLHVCKRFQVAIDVRAAIIDSQEVCIFASQDRVPPIYSNPVDVHALEGTSVWALALFLGNQLQNDSSNLPNSMPWQLDSTTHQNLHAFPRANRQTNDAGESILMSWLAPRKRKRPLKSPPAWRKELGSAKLDIRGRKPLHRLSVSISWRKSRVAWIRKRRQRRKPMRLLHWENDGKRQPAYFETHHGHRQWISNKDTLCRIHGK